MKRRPGLVGLNFVTAMARPAPPRRSRSSRPRAAARWPSSSRAACRWKTPRRFGFGCTLTMLTRSTLTSNSCSTAWRICVLCASLCTLNVYLRSAMQAVALLRDDRARAGSRWDAGSSRALRPVRRPSPRRAAAPPRVTSSERAQTTAATSSSAGTVTSTRGRLRNDLTSASSSSVRDDEERRVLAPGLEQLRGLLRRRAPRTAGRRRARACRSRRGARARPAARRAAPCG